MYEGGSLRIVINTVSGSKDIMIDQAWTVGDLDHEIPVIPVVKISADPCPLRLPVKPGSQTTVMDIVITYLNVNGRMKLDAGNLMTKILMFHRNIINMVMINPAEYTSHMSHDPVLSAVIDHIVTDDMGTDSLLTPAALERTKHCFHLILISRLPICPGTEIVSRAFFFPDTDSAAFRVMDDIILDHPSFRPVHTQKRGLICRGRCPGTGCLRHLKSAYRNIISSDPYRIEAASAYIYLNQLLIRIYSLEVGIDGCVLIVHLRIPLVYGIFRMPDRFRILRPQAAVPFGSFGWVLYFHQRLRLIESLSVQIDLPCMQSILRKFKPIST